MKILVIHGPNLGLLGRRENTIYGSKSLKDLDSRLIDIAEKNDQNIEIYQSDNEGDIVTCIGKSTADAIIINAGAYTHTSLAIADALRAFSKPVIEVHLSNIYQRESFRHHSYIASVSQGQISGLGFYSYILALQYFIEKTD